MLKGIGNYYQKLVFTVIAGLILLLIYHGIKMLLLLFAGALLAILWRGISRWVCTRTKISFNICLPVVILLNIGSIVLFFWLAYPSIAEQATRLSEELPKAITQLENNLRDTQVGSFLLELVNTDQKFMDNISGEMGKLFTAFTDTLGVLIDILLILVFALFLVGNPGLYVRGFLHLIPKEKRERVLEVIVRTKDTLFRWFIGKIVDMFSIFVMTLLGLWLLGMPLIFTFALIAFFFSFVPNIGPIISLIPPLAISFIEGPNMPLYVALLYLGVQMFESYFITPKIQQRAAFVPPVLLLLVQFLFAAFIGVLGLLLSTPLLVGLMVPIQMLYVKDYLGDNTLEEEN